MEEQTQSPPVTPTEPPPQSQQPLAPHRGVLILILGILGIVCCFICGIVAWVMGNGDLKEMAAGRMDPAGEGMTKAGKICGIVGIALQLVGIIIQLIIMMLGAGLAVTAQ
ncbi:MAG: DUF4190 domain-containing protein [Planctomycetota bacterium]|jgi:hypothetical protein